MIERCCEAGLPEPEFKLTDGFVTVIRRKPGKAFEAVGGKVGQTFFKTDGCRSSKTNLFPIS
ncbi:MAG: hypothetical protein BM485_04365 [Desulfobulbaceae bacterium DB1]|nr:MAG: hypothetical protein BM485_04365 [Desulfobulbaceae bacterium DB1]